MLQQQHKILFMGPLGAGKTTAIAAISEIEPVRTEVLNTTPDLVDRQTMRVGVDYGEITLENGEKLRLYGTPGQDRFRVIWDVLSEGAFGVVILVDHSQPDYVRQFCEFLDAYAELIHRTGAVVGITRTDVAGDCELGPYYEALLERSLILPVLTVDARRAEHVVELIKALLRMLEVRHGLLEGDANGAPRSSEV